MKRVIFIHVPRTAGRSMEQFAEKHAAGCQKRRNNEYDPSIQFTNLRHRGAESVMEKGWFSREQWESSFKFAFVRNPWDRLVSLYRHLIKFRYSTKREKGSTAYLSSFRKFALEVTSGESKFVRSIHLKNVSLFSQANPQVEWLRCGLNFIGRFEDLDHDWEVVCREVGWEHRQLKRVNVSKNRKPYRSCYDDELKNAVDRYYAEDIETFGYKF